MKCPDLPSALSSVLHKKEFPVSEPPENLILAIATMILLIIDSKKGTMLIGIRHLKQAVLYLKPIY
jgi:hypothetical protein